MSKRGHNNDETRGVEAPGPIDRALDRDRDDKADILEGGADRTGTRARGNKETPGIEAPGPIDRALERDRDDQADILEGGADRTGTRAAGERRDRGAAQEGEIRVPIAEERLNVGKRDVELGEVQVRKTVTEEEQTAAVTLTRDEVNVREVDTADRPLRAGEDAFQETTIRVPVRGEEAVVAKEAVVTGEVVIEKDRVAEERQITDTVRKQRVDVDENYRQVRGEFERFHAARAGGTGRAFAESEPNYRTGFEAGHDERYAGRAFDEVEPEIRRDYATRGVGADRWAELREEIREGWQKARNR